MNENLTNEAKAKAEAEAKAKAEAEAKAKAEAEAKAKAEAEAKAKAEAEAKAKKMEKEVKDLKALNAELVAKTEEKPRGVKQAVVAVTGSTVKEIQENLSDRKAGDNSNSEYVVKTMLLQDGVLYVPGVGYKGDNSKRLLETGCIQLRSA